MMMEETVDADPKSKLKHSLTDSMLKVDKTGMDEHVHGGGDGGDAIDGLESTEYTTWIDSIPTVRLNSLLILRTIAIISCIASYLLYEALLPCTTSLHLTSSEISRLQWLMLVLVVLVIVYTLYLSFIKALLMPPSSDHRLFIVFLLYSLCTGNAVYALAPSWLPLYPQWASGVAIMCCWSTAWARIKGTSLLSVVILMLHYTSIMMITNDALWVIHQDSTSMLVMIVSSVMPLFSVTSSIFSDNFRVLIFNRYLRLHRQYERIVQTRRDMPTVW